jgi:Cu/Ag efflux protein CusF
MKPHFLPLLAAILFAVPLHAEPMQSGSMHDGSMTNGAKMQHGPMPASAIAMSEGVVRRIDTGAGKITLKHGPIANLDMPPMTMVFRVQKPELLSKVKAGDTVKFRAEDIGGALTVTAIEKVQ